MMKGLLVGFAILAVSTSAALAAKKTHKPKEAAAATATVTPVMWPGTGVSAADKALYAKNQHDSGMKK